MIRIVLQEAVALSSVGLFVMMIGIWAGVFTGALAGL